MRNVRMTIWVMVVALAVLSLNNTVFAAWAFTNIADTSGPFDDMGNTHGFNDSGTVAFSASQNGVGGGLYTGNGGELTTIVTTNTPGGYYTGDNGHSMNNDGTVVFTGHQGLGIGIGMGNGGEITVVVPNPVATGIHNVHGPIINNDGTVAFRGSLPGLPNRSGHFGVIATVSDGVVTTIADNTGGYGEYTEFGVPAMNNDGTVAFIGTNGGWDPGRQSLLVGSEGALTTIVESSEFYRLSPGVVINDTGTIVFTAWTDPETRAFYTVNDGELDLFLDVSGGFSGFDTPSINNDGLIAFRAGLDTGGLGIFIGADPINDKVIYEGDALFNSTVTRIDFWHSGLNNMGQIAFRYELSNGIDGIAIATIPEPTTLLLLGLGGLMIRRKR